MRIASETLGNVLKADLCVSTTNETSYAKGHNAVKYNHCIDKKSTA